MTHTFTQLRTHSLTNPERRVGMYEEYAKPGTVFTKEVLEGYQPPLYTDRIKEMRGEAGLTENYVLQGYSDGQWVTLKSIILLPGEEPEPDFGACAECGTALEESEFALGNLCRQCLDAELEAREAATW